MSNEKQSKIFRRHSVILEIIKEKDITTQEELTNELKKRDIKVTQATVSRDIRELRLIKTRNGNGLYKYAAPEKNDDIFSEKLLNIFREAYKSSDCANNLIVVKTISGMAQACAFVIDSIESLDILGTIAGDDTVMIICRDNKIALELVEKFKKMII